MSVHKHGRDRALSETNLHALLCRAIVRPSEQLVAKLAREVRNDLRAELPRLEARAAAGIALSAAVLIGVVGNPLGQPAYAFSVLRAGRLTLALLLFASVLMPVATK